MTNPTARSYRIGVSVRTLLRTGRAAQTAMARRLSLGDTDLSAMDELVGSAEPLGPVELGNRLGIRSASATILVDRLVAAGYLRREPHPRDRQRVTLHTTDAARAEVTRAVAPMMRAFDVIAGGLDDHDADVVERFLSEVTRAMLDYAVSAGVPRSGGQRRRVSTTRD